MIPCYATSVAQADLLDETLRTVDEQDYPSFEVIVVDDGSPFEGFCYDAPAVTKYRRYSASSSRDGERMLRSIRTVYERQRASVKGDAAGEAAFERGLAQLTEIFRDCLVENLVDRVRGGDWTRALRSARMLLTESPRRLTPAMRRLLVPRRVAGGLSGTR